MIFSLRYNLTKIIKSHQMKSEISASSQPVKMQESDFVKLFYQLQSQLKTTISDHIKKIGEAIGSQDQQSDPTIQKIKRRCKYQSLQYAKSIVNTIKKQNINDKNISFSDLVNTITKTVSQKIKFEVIKHPTNGQEQAQIENLQNKIVQLFKPKVAEPSTNSTSNDTVEIPNLQKDVISGHEVDELQLNEEVSSNDTVEIPDLQEDVISGHEVDELQLNEEVSSNDTVEIPDLQEDVISGHEVDELPPVFDTVLTDQQEQHHHYLDQVQQPNEKLQLHVDQPFQQNHQQNLFEKQIFQEINMVHDDIQTFEEIFDLSFFQLDHVFFQERGL